MSTAAEHRIHAIRTLLETYRDAIESLQSGNGQKQTAETVLPWHELYHSNDFKQGSYGELEHVLRRLRAWAPSLYWHVTRRFLCSERVTRTVRKDGFGRWRDLDTSHARVVWAVMDKHGTHANRYQAIVERWHPAVSLDAVDQALALMERIWQGEPRVPPAVLEPIQTQRVADAA